MSSRKPAGNVIQLGAAKKVLAARDRYRDQLGETVGHLESAAEELFTDAVNLAVNGPWKDWDATQPKGTQLEFTMAALADTKDARLTMVVNMIGQLRQLADVLRKP